MTSFSIHTPQLTHGSILIEIAHSGTKVSKEEEKYFETVSGFPFLDADLFLDELYRTGDEKTFYTTIIQNISRYVIDVDQPPYDVNRLILDEESQSASSFCYTSKGIIPLFTSNQDWLISKKLSLSEIQRRLKEYYFPYHEQIKYLGNSLKEKNGFVIIINARSMCSQGKAIHRDTGIRPDIDLVSHLAKTCHKDILELSFEFFRSSGLKAKMNSVHSGGFCNSIYGKPQKKAHSLQIELNRALYMDESTFQKHEKNFRELKALLHQYIDQLAALNFS